MINFGCNIVSINSSQLMNLTTTPVNLLNGMTNEIIVPHRVVLSYIAGSMPYKGDGDNMVISLGTITFGKIDSNFLKGNINLLSLINIQDWKNLTTANSAITELSEDITKLKEFLDSYVPANKD